MPLRITGLVKAHNSIRERLSRGIPLQEHHRFREEVQRVLFVVETLCRNEGMTPEDLPTPSRNAYRFLEGIDLRVIPTPHRTRQRPRCKVPTIRNVTAIMRDAGLEMWLRFEHSNSSRERRVELAQRLERSADNVLDICDGSQCSPSDLATPTRQAFAWLQFLSDPAHLELHFNALTLARNHLPLIGRTPDDWILQPVVFRSLFRMQPRGAGTQIRCAEAYVVFDDSFWTPFVLRSRNPRQDGLGDLVEEFSHKSEFKELQSKIESPILPGTESAVGRHHDLNKSFQRVVTEYFDSTLESPTLQWSRTPASRTFGKYVFTNDRILIASTLDHPDVPEFVIDFVIYHELLHKIHGITRTGGRSRTHTAAFRDEEKTFKRYQEAESFLQQWSQKLNR